MVKLSLQYVIAKVGRVPRRGGNGMVCKRFVCWGTQFEGEEQTFLPPCLKPELSQLDESGVPQHSERSLRSEDLFLVLCGKNPSFSRLVDRRGFIGLGMAVRERFQEAVLRVFAQHQVTHYRTETSEKRGIVALQISMRECSGVSVLDLLGRSTIDGGESELLSRHLRDLTANGKRKLLLNLMNLSQIDSSGVSIIVEMCVSLKRIGGELKLLSPRGRVLDVLKVFRLLDVIPSFEDETEALQSF
jgi:anti-anti-sigma factor